MFKIYYSTPFCYLSLQSDGKTLIQLDFCDDKGEEKSCEILLQACKELDLYFLGKLKKFSIPLRVQGSKFEQKVYQALMQIPYGKTATYKEIAQNINHPKAFRAVGNANSKNQLPIFIPCHRVVASNGIGGYNGGIKIKKFLMELERKFI
ncbi:methylated-DNA--[protein]-cysteine S-methyltransferase [Campylobacter sp. US33a]|uniref:Methylated-DNA--protein-cysteine methyltransferase n=1 Tax=Campylobacter sp. CCS1377 TaxID=3158229 RepID=A0AAU7E6T1_9BACT|nr:methylated-DNA--[protein]-cysteine S-methyltransferase [Campylobacter sp. US33a]MCW1360132.1 methylated-DNA--[protein]-cysteine S-methyltransferase [Campylobacter jejuni]TEY03465.1 methylated-DNA--[protein]-cysteine S-methyltransferase [Campylobacter sp. US33a]